MPMNDELMADSVAHVRRHQQALYDFATYQVLVDDVVNVRGVHKGVPHAFGIDHCHRACRTAVQATRLVHANLAGAREFGLANQLLAAVKPGLGLVLGAAVFSVFALIEAEEDVPLEIRLLVGAG